MRAKDRKRWTTFAENYRRKFPNEGTNSERLLRKHLMEEEELQAIASDRYADATREIAFMELERRKKLTAHETMSERRARILARS